MASLAISIATLLLQKRPSDKESNFGDCSSQHLLQRLTTVYYDVHNVTYQILAQNHQCRVFDGRLNAGLVLLMLSGPRFSSLCSFEPYKGSLPYLVATFNPIRTITTYKSCS